jgi:poly(A) polymerase
MIDPDALKIMYRLIHYGFKAFLVGGGVRDLLLNKKPKDFDIATDATPRRVKAIFSNSRIIGRRFKLVHVFFRGSKIIEVATFRDASDEDGSEGESGDDRRSLGDNRYGTEATDALRRDLTINGLFYDLSTFSIIDYVGGVQDLNAGIVRVIGDPDVRFAEDPVRLVRVVRHAARSGFQIDTVCRESILRNHHLITSSSTMRVYEEVKKDLTCGHFCSILQLLHAHQLLQHLLPELEAGGGELLKYGSRFTESLQRADELSHAGTAPSPTAVLALLALFSSGAIARPDPYALDNPENAPTEFLKGCFAKLAVPRKERERVEHLLNIWFDLGKPPYPPERLGRALRREGAEDLQPLLLMLGYPPLSAELVEAARRARPEIEEEDDGFGERPRRGRRRGRRGGRGRGRTAANAESSPDTDDIGENPAAGEHLDQKQRRRRRRRQISHE